MYLKLKNAEYRLYSLVVQHYFLIQNKHLSRIEEYNGVYWIKYEVINNWINDDQQKQILVYMDRERYHKVAKALAYFGNYVEEDDIKLCDIYNRLASKLLISAKQF